jgi:outer membrane protein OmpA-like peptidoglycan-associated protein
VARPSVDVVDLQTLPKTIGIEHTDRVNRFQRLAKMQGTRPPEIDEMQVSVGQLSGVDYAVPVVRVRFEEKVFFDFNRDTVRGDAAPVLDIMAENMKRDVPDAQLTVLGHTDAIGSDAYNKDLSLRRAASVMKALIDRGVRVAQLSTVAVGESQPVASNLTDGGRDLNRRVEFMISADERANLALVHKRRINRDFLRTTQAEKTAPAKAQDLKVLKPEVWDDPAKASAAPVKLKQTGSVTTSEPMSQAEIAKLAPPPDVRLMKPKEYQQAKLDNEFGL